MRESFVFYKSFAEAIKHLDEKDQLRALWDIIDYALDEELPTEDGIPEAIFVMARPVIDKNNVQYQNGAKGGRPKNPTVTQSEPNHNPIVTQSKPNRNPIETQSKPNHNPIETQPEPYVDVDVDIDVDIDDDVDDDVDVDVEREGDMHGAPKKHTPRFTPPTVEQVRDYCTTSGHVVDAERFVDFYSSKGWMVGKNKMKDWRAAVRNWERREQKDAQARKPEPVKSNFMNFDEREYDYDALQAKLILQSMGKGE